eukprot:Gb_22804 [translate_table: standard]
MNWTWPPRVWRNGHGFGLIPTGPRFHSLNLPSTDSGGLLARGLEVIGVGQIRAYSSRIEADYLTDSSSWLGLVKALNNPPKLWVELVLELPSVIGCNKSVALPTAATIMIHGKPVLACECIEAKLVTSVGTNVHIITWGVEVIHDLMFDSPLAARVRNFQSVLLALSLVGAWSSPKLD